MNTIKASVSNIQSVDNLSIVTFEVDGIWMQMMSLGLNTPIKIGSKVLLGVKSSNVLIAKDLSGMLSASNQLTCRVKSVNNGELLSSVKLTFGDDTIQSVITKNSSLKMNLMVGDEVLAIIKSSELSILEVQDS